ncbi:MAG: SDR family oxidoreductase [Thiotrichaceae bacterium]|nr:SDR family oxidoreductase [Thiotrichaceae bacterium]
MGSIAVTGAAGFLGKALVVALTKEQREVRALTRLGINGEGLAVGDIGPDTCWFHLLEGVDVVIHTAARVHIIDDTTKDPLTAFRQVNVEGTRRLAEDAAKAGVRRLVFISSIKVNGESTLQGEPFLASNLPGPVDPYGISKLEAEDALKVVASTTGMEVVIIRPPLVYGLGVKANFFSMMRWLNKGVPLPFGAIHNKRSLVALDNLVDLIVTCIDHPAAANQTFLVSDGEDLSTAELLQRTAGALGKSVWLFPVPESLLKAGATLLGKRDVAQRLLGSLQVDISKTRGILGWRPPVSVDDALKKTAEDFHLRKQS